MANPIMKFYSTIDSKLPQLDVVNGQLIFVNDTRKIYLDANGVRTEYAQIITLVNEEQRIGILAPLSGFYFVHETNTFWKYSDGNWTQLTTPPLEKIIFLENDENLPTEGQDSVVYISDTKIYKWDKDKYVELGGSYWESF